MQCIPIHEAVRDDMLGDPSLLLRLDEAIEDGTLPPAYFDNPIVKRERERVGGGKRVLPYSLFLDGVPYSLTDSVTGVWVKNELTGKRDLLAVLRKRLLCRCGCRGWCSF